MSVSLKSGEETVHFLCQGGVSPGNHCWLALIVGDVVDVCGMVFHPLVVLLCGLDGAPRHVLASVS